MIYYVYNDTAADLSIDFGFNHQLQYCPTQCSLTEADTIEATHHSIKSFDENVAKLVINTSDYRLIDSMLTLKVECQSILSEKTRYASDLITIAFEDPCQFDKVSFKDSVPIEDYFIYYVNSTDPYEVIVNHGFE